MHERFMQRVLILVLGFVFGPLLAGVVGWIFKSDALAIVVFVLVFGAWVYLLHSDLRLPFAITWEEEQRRLRETDEIQGDSENARRFSLKAPSRIDQLKIALVIIAMITFIFAAPLIVPTLN